MNVSILHISDLHQHRRNPLRNDVLLNSLVNDHRHFSAEEEPRIRTPDLIVVSGDIVQGVGPEVKTPEECLHDQYQRAAVFLGQLADQFVNGDRERVIIVPGNHDVSAYHFRKSLCPVDVPSGAEAELVKQLFRPESPLRWSWRHLGLFRITDSAIYKQRMAAFAHFYSEFYQGKRRYSLDPALQLDIFDYPEFALSVVGFSSCYNNDLYNTQGAMHPACIANAGERLDHPSLCSRLRLGVWHHDTDGSPSRNDYMDPDFIQNLIDRGFSLGLHGHQHRPRHLDTKFRHGIERRITLISAGTLCGRPDSGHKRAYNVIELDTTERTGRLHVREMQNDKLELPIWGRRAALPPNAQPYYTIRYDAPPSSPCPDETTPVLIEAQNLHTRGSYKEASDLLLPILSTEELARNLLLDCLVNTQDIDKLLRIFDPPASDAESIHVMEALWDSGQRERLQKVIASPEIADSDDPSVVEIRQKYAARLR